jgi:hypothetical protein
VLSSAPRARVDQTDISRESHQETPSEKAEKEIENFPQKTKFVFLGDNG